MAGPSTPAASVAVCHDWAFGRWGSERTAARLARLVGARVLYTFAVEPNVADALFSTFDLRTSWLSRFSFVRRHHQWLLPMMPFWWRRQDLTDYDVVVTSSHAVVNSIRTDSHTLHLSYCYTPMRYAWLWRDELNRIPRHLRPLWRFVAARLRVQDRRRSANVDAFLAISTEVADRVRRFYGRESDVVYPPVDTDFYTPDATVPREDFLLYAGRLVAYKQPEIAVEAAKAARQRLVVAGGGPRLGHLRALAGSDVDFVEDPSDEQLRDLYRRARGLVFPGLEDFGIVPVEAQACGAPVIAFAGGGALETVIDGRTGVLYNDRSTSGLVGAINRFVELELDPAEARHNAERFSPAQFDQGIRAAVARVEERRADSPS